MTGPRFLALVGRTEALRDRLERRLRASCNAPSQRPAVIERPGLVVATWASEEPLVSPDGECVLLGAVFRHRTGERLRRLEGPASDLSERLIGDHWGHYLAFIAGADDEPVTILRAPFGSLPCLYARTPHGLLVASDLDMLALGGWTSTGVAWDEVLAHLVARDVPRSHTCLAGVRELRGGACLTLARDNVLIANAWSPWDCVAAATRPRNRQEAAGAVRQAVVKAVRASTFSAERPLLMLSGGLDSSIVAASLAITGKAFSCLNLVSDDASGDERRYARAVAGAFGANLEEARRQVENVDVTRSEAAHLPRPSARGFIQDSNRLTLAAAQAAGCDLVVDGGGGDNVFCSLQSVAPVADALRRSGSWSEVWQAARAIARLAEASVPVVLSGALRRAWLRPPAYRWPLDLGCLPEDLRDVAIARVDHPWLRPPPGADPGGAAHVALLVAAQNWVEGLDPRAEPPSFSPLLAQPVVEACLAVPSWWWFEDGRNRAVARRAFADILPQAAVERRSKASPDSFVAELFERNRATIRTMLRDGRLADQGLIDRAAVEAVVAGRAPVRGQAYRRIMRLVDVEAWVRHWS